MVRRNHPHWTSPSNPVPKKLYNRSKQFYKRKYMLSLKTIKNLKEINKGLALKINLLKHELSVMKDNERSGLKTEFALKMDCRNANMFNYKLKSVMRSASTLTVNAIMNLGFLSEDLLSCQKLLSEAISLQSTPNPLTSNEDEEDSNLYTPVEVSGKQTNSRAARPVYPMVNGHTISKPTVTLQRVQIPAGPSSQERVSLGSQTIAERGDPAMSPIPEESSIVENSPSNPRPVTRLGRRNNRRLPEKSQTNNFTLLKPLVKLEDIRDIIEQSNESNAQIADIQSMANEDTEDEREAVPSKAEGTTDSAFDDNQPGPSGLGRRTISPAQEPLDTPALPNVTTSRPKKRYQLGLCSDTDSSCEDLSLASTTKDAPNELLPGPDVSVNPEDEVTQDENMIVNENPRLPADDLSQCSGIIMKRKKGYGKAKRCGKAPQRRKADVENKTDSSPSTDTPINEPSPSPSREISQKATKRKSNSNAMENEDDFSNDVKSDVQNLQLELLNNKVKLQVKKAISLTPSVLVKCEPLTPATTPNTSNGSLSCSQSTQDDSQAPSTNDGGSIPKPSTNENNNHVKEEDLLVTSRSRRARNPVSYKEMHLNSKLRRNHK